MQQQAVLVACSTEANIIAWDLNTATQLAQYKSNSSGRNRCCRLGSDYFVSAQNSKDAVHFWAWHKDQVLQRCFIQEPLTALASSPNGALLAGGGSSGTLYCWETASGRLLCSWPAHYRAVSCLQFSDSGGLLVSAGEDTLVCAWLLAEVLDERRDMPAAAAAAAAGTARVEPLFTWSEHTLPVSSVHLGCGGPSALLVTASLDHSIKLWSLTSGKLLRTVTLPAGITAVTLDAGEHVLLAGCTDGSIWEVSLIGQQQQQQQQQQSLAAVGAAGSSSAAAAAAASAAAAAGIVGGPGSCCYEGHTKAISSLAITPDGELLVSGCEDGSVRVWDLRSRQCLRVISSPNKAPVSTALLLDWPSHLTGFGQQAGSSSGGRQGPKRMQPLAPLAKFAGAVTTPSKPWEGPPVILTGQLCQPSCVAAAPAAVGGMMLLPALMSPLESLQQLVARDTAAAASSVDQQVMPAAGLAGGDQSGGGTNVAEAAGLQQQQQQIQQLQDQLREAQRVSQRWQALHAELHEFCTQNVLVNAAAPASGAGAT